MLIRITLAAITLLTISTVASAQHSGILGKSAPPIVADSWDRLPAGAEKFDLAQHKGKIVFLYCFQAHCSGCRESGFPRVNKLYKKYAKDKQIQFVAVQTTFGGDTFAQAKQIMDRFELKGIPVGQDNVENGLPKTARAYQTGGTPWMAIIDKKGIVRANAFHIEVPRAIKLIEQLKAEN